MRCRQLRLLQVFPQLPIQDENPVHQFGNLVGCRDKPGFVLIDQLLELGAIMRVFSGQKTIENTGH